MAHQCLGCHGGCRALAVVPEHVIIARRGGGGRGSIGGRRSRRSRLGRDLGLALRRVLRLELGCHAPAVLQLLVLDLLRRRISLQVAFTNVQVPSLMEQGRRQDVLSQSPHMVSAALATARNVHHNAPQEPPV